MSSITYQVTITMQQDTVQALTDNGYILYAFKGVQATAPCLPIVWLSTTSFAEDMIISWHDEYQAYTSTSPMEPDIVVIPENTYPIALGETLVVTEPTGSGSVVGSGIAGAVSIENRTSSDFTCGISQYQPDGTAIPLYAF